MLLHRAGAVGLLCAVAPILVSVVLFVQAHESRSRRAGLSGKNDPLRVNWPQFRGPNGSGVGEARNLPIDFGPAKNVLWKTAVLPGVSSPVLAGDQLLLTASKGRSCFVICLNRQTGLELWRRSIGTVHTTHRHPLNDRASPTPLTDGENVYAFFPDFGLVSFDLAGNMRWKVSLRPFASLHGICSSPILADGKIVLLIDQAQDSFVAAFDRNDGHLLWKTSRPDAAGGYSTPLAYVLKSRARQVIVSSPRELVGYSAENGEKVWWVEQMGFQPQTSPILDQEVVYANVFGGSEYWENTEDFGSIDKDHDGKITAAEFPESWGQLAGSILDANQDGILTPSEWQAFGRRIRGGGASALLAVRLGGQGNLTEKAVAWRFTKSLPGISSPVLYKHVLYLVKGGGIVTAVDPAAGRILNQTRLIGALDDYFSSPVAAEDKIYLTSLSGKVSVLKAGTGLQILAMNDLDDECYASPAVGVSEIYIRTRHTLYAFRKE